ncbi:hypothetical protein ASG37_05065 [Sphingomonas sp. Leaf407]|uniref:hypothetical protein n=1 Tax=unclassified Sphingomonas TaxID=196159 RepID=UPI0006FE9AA3|nr:MULTISPECIES: hypothetical protein [unclassified Sphingomonas]KQN37033.1 hypothetical protein ASE97_10980 [Sphingomonas sp. Leaf42]KQT30460.1 hypothetical protein ASG37_05065 [Sphingomonas sp. Leaf407]
MTVATLDVQRAARRARSCFTLARSSTFAGERDAAIARGILMAEKAGLSLDGFDIPGRVRQRQTASSTTANRPGIAERMRGSESDFREAIREAADTRRRWAEELRVGDDESIYDAKRRAFNEATAAAAERDSAAGRRASDLPDRAELRLHDLRERWPSVDAAINALKARRIVVHPATNLADPATPAWFAPVRGLQVLDEWQLRELADEVMA